MNRVLLVDDDPIVLLHLRKMIDWSRLECELVAEAANGRDAIEAIDLYLPQIVITDINMPGINGMDLIQYIHKRGQNIQVIAISAFDDFSYVRGSLKGGARDYLLKHQLSEDVLEDAISGAVEELKQDSDSGTEYSLQEKKEHLMYSILHSRISERDLHLMEEISMRWLKEELVLVLAEADEKKKGQNMDMLLVLMDETIKYYQEYQILPLEKGLFLLLFSAKDKRLREIPAVVEQIQSNLRRFCSVEMSFVMSDPVESYTEVEKTIPVCRRILKEEHFKGRDGFIVGFREQTETKMYHWDLEQMEQFVRDIGEGRPVEEVFDRIYEPIYTGAYSRNQIQFFFVEMIALLLRRLEGLGVKEEEAFPDMDLYEEFLQLETLEEIRRYLIEKYRVLQKYIQRSSIFSGCSSVVKGTAEYIRQRFKEKISLSEIAEALSVSPSYLSRVFKKETGMNVTAYINQVRMEEAKRLMNESTMSLNEISWEIGISNYNYFYLLFKDMYGITPSDYMKKTERNEK